MAWTQLRYKAEIGTVHFCCVSQNMQVLDQNFFCKAMSEVVRFSVCLLLLGKELLREAGGNQVPRVKV
jgi:hypothetical protein